MNSTPLSNRLHIAIFGRRNAGKSSLINALTNQNVAIVSPVAGTTTDPVHKTMEILPLGPTVIIDTAGIDDAGSLGELRVQRSLEVLRQTDVVILAIDATGESGIFEQNIVERCQQQNIPVIIALNKIDLAANLTEYIDKITATLAITPIPVSAQTRAGIDELKKALIHHAPAKWDQQTIIGDLLAPNDIVVLVTPIDAAAPKGRLILPQVQTLRDILDADALGYVVKETQLETCLRSLAQKPRIVVTDSQVFEMVNKITPEDIPLTSFSILLARAKGELATMVAGSQAIRTLKPGDKVLIAEACTHHRVQDDIGTVKLPRWINEHVGGEIIFEHSSGHGFPNDLAQYKLVLHCGACMINRREMLSRILQARQINIPIVNYGVAIAYLKGILPRALSPFPEIQHSL